MPRPAVFFFSLYVGWQSKFTIFLSVFKKVATEKDNGMLVYKDDHDPLALELYQGHIRLMYDITKYPPTTVYRQVYTRESTV